MQASNLTGIYFSATGTTAKCVEAISAAIGLPVDKSINLADRSASMPAEFGEGDVALVAAPVYGGRIPAICAEKLSALKASGSRAIAVVLYGNRNYDDSLLELTDILKSAGFKVMAAAAFIGQHSIFPKAGLSRPDKDDIDALTEFGKACRAALERTEAPELPIKGNRPYKTYGGVPLHPSGSEQKCHQCGRCSELCPVEAIDPLKPWETDAALCITCGRCIASCPTGARHYGGLKYKLTGKLFTAAFSKRKVPETFL